MSSRLSAIAQDTVAIVQRGSYPHPAGGAVTIAPNRAVMLRDQPGDVDRLEPILQRRCERVLRIAVAHGHRRIVLGAWGCGVFGNDPATVARVFSTALRRTPCFERVVFAVLDRQPGTPTHAAFAERFAPAR